MRQGEVRRGQAHSVLVIVSSDLINAVVDPIVVPIGRGGLHHPPFEVALSDTDPVAGYVSVRDVGRYPAALLGPSIGMVSGGTFEQILHAVQDLFRQD